MSLDPLGHIKITVKNFQKSKIFYTQLFGQLGFTQIADKKESSAWSTKEGFGIWISQAKNPEQTYVFGSPGLHHICFKAESRKLIDELYSLFVAQDIFIFDKPQTYPQYTPNYYAVFFADPDGIKIEVAIY